MDAFHSYLAQRLKSIVALKKLKKDMDPASGVSISVRRGVSRDNVDIEDDAERRPWTTVESSDLTAMEKVIDVLIEEEQRSARFWAKRIRENIKDEEAALAAFAASGIPDGSAYPKS